MIVLLLALAVLGFGKGKPDKGNTHDNEGIDYHQSYVMNADGGRSSTWVVCRCPAAQPGGSHDGAVPEPPKPNGPQS